MLTISVGDRSFTLTDEEEKALLTDVADIAEWVENFVRNKVRRVTDRIIEENTAYNPQKLGREEKLKVLSSLKLKAAAERNAE